MSLVIRSIDDLSDRQVAQVFDRSRALAGGRDLDLDRAPPIVGSIFLDASLRTRVGFSVAAARLGWRSVEVFATRANERSVAESWGDTLRTVSGMVDVVVARPGVPLDRASIRADCRCAFLNAGDEGPSAEHPSQALIDLFAAERLRGPIGELVVAICGDLHMRAVRSLLRLLARRPPRRLALIPTPTSADVAIPGALRSVAERRDLRWIEDVDVLYVAGIPHGAATERVRTALRIDAATMARLPVHAVVLSPLPIIDEIGSDARADHRMNAFEQSDLSVPVRMALLECLVGNDRVD